MSWSYAKLDGVVVRVGSKSAAGAPRACCRGRGCPPARRRPRQASVGEMTTPSVLPSDDGSPLHLYGKGGFPVSRQERPAPRLTSSRESSRHRSGYGCMRIRNRPGKRRAPAGARLRVVEDPASDRPEARLKTIFDGVTTLIDRRRPTSSCSRRPSSGSSPAPRSLSGRPAAPSSSPPRSPGWTALSTRPHASSRLFAATAAPRRRRCSRWCRRSSASTRPRAEPRRRRARGRDCQRWRGAVKVVSG